MKIVRHLVGSRLWVAMAAASWSVESFDRCHTDTQWTLVAHVFFLTWIAYLFLTDHAIRTYRAYALLALTGGILTFQGLESLGWIGLCTLLVLLYRSHWVPASWANAHWEARNIPLLNNIIIACCWLMMCMLWPLQQSGVAFETQAPFIISGFCWVLALSMGEDLWGENMPDATVRQWGQRTTRAVAIALVIVALAINIYFEEAQPSVWIAMLFTLILLLMMRSGKKTPAKSFWLDATVVARFPF